MKMNILKVGQAGKQDLKMDFPIRLKLKSIAFKE